MLCVISAIWYYIYVCMLVVCVYIERWGLVETETGNELWGGGN